MKTNRIMSLMLIFALLLVAFVPARVVFAEVGPGTLNIHKHYFPNSIPEDLQAGIGEEEAVPAGALPLEGAQFSIWKIDDMDGEAYKVEVTGGNGLAKFEGLPLGRYYVEETGLPKGVTQFSEPFYIDIPMTNIGGDGHIYDVHVYPKNALILGAAQLFKYNEEEAGLGEAEFDFYQVVKEDTDGAIELLPGIWALKLNEDPLVTDGSGYTPVVGDLEVGNYYFVETKAPEGYGLNTSPISVEIEAHAYDGEGQLIEENVVVAHLDNYEKPDVDKEVSDDSAGIGDTVTWTIRPDVPGDIENYDKYDILDTLDAALSYVSGSTKVYVNDVEVTQGFTLTEPLATGGGQLIVSFVVGENLILEAGDSLRIEFDTIINENAVVGVIDNEAILDYDNGFEEDSSTSPRVEVVVGGKKFIKVDGSNNQIVLENAGFVVFKVVDEVNLYLVKGEDGMISWSEDIDDAFVFESDENGLVDIVGLAYGAYFLEEVQAPLNDEGIPYNLLLNPVEFEVDEDSYDDEDVTLIENNERPTLPQTGGIGTALFTIIGLGLMGIGAKSYKKKD